MKVEFNWIGGATFILTIDDLKIAVDPVLCPKGTVQDFFWFKSKRIEDPVYSESDFDNIDLWLITHEHEDHLDEIGLSKIHSETLIISEKKAARILKKHAKNYISILNWKQKTSLATKGFQIDIEAIPAIHGVNPLSAFFAGNVNGYYLTISKDDECIRIYITSDTVYKDKVINAMKNKVIDLMIPNMGAAKQGTWLMALTMNAKMLARMISKLEPKMIVPVHFGTFSHYNEAVSKIEELNEERIKIVPIGSKTILSFKTKQT